MSSNKQAVILFGPPGAGKGTQAELLSDKLGFYYFETSKFLERAFNPANPIKEVEADGKVYSMQEEREMWNLFSLKQESGCSVGDWSLEGSVNLRNGHGLN